MVLSDFFGKKKVDLIKREQSLWKELQELHKAEEELKEKRALLSADLMKGNLGKQDLDALSELEQRLGEAIKQIAEKSAELSMLQSFKPIGRSLEEENAFLKDVLRQKESELESLKKEQSSFNEEKESKLKLFKALLEKYSDLINETEKKTVGQIKALIDSENLTIQSLAQRFRKENYAFEKHYLESLDALLSFIYREITLVSLEPDLKLSCWLKPEEIMELKMADNEDIAVFACSLMKALGDRKAAVLINELSDLSTKAFILTEFNGMHYLIDVAGKKATDSFKGSTLEEALGSFNENGLKIKKTLYKFNNEAYEQFI